MDKELDINFEIIRAVENAAPHRAKLDTEITEKRNYLMAQYRALRAKGNPEIQIIMKTTPSKRTEEDVEKLKLWKKQMNQEFKALKAFIYPTNPMARPMESLAQKIALVVKMLRYLEIDDFDNALSTRGMSVEATPLEDESVFWKDKDTKSLAMDIFDQVREVSLEEMNEKAAINEVEFGNLPSQITYSTDNKSGITVSQFAKLVKAKSVALVRGDEQYSAYKHRLVEKDSGAINSATTILDVTKEM